MIFGLRCGPRMCIGQGLARTELRVFLEEWLARIPDFQLKPGFALKGIVESAGAIESLPLVWTPRA